MKNRLPGGILNTEKTIQTGETIAYKLQNGRIVSLSNKIPEGTAVVKIPAGSGEGREIYRRGLILALDQAVKRKFPDSTLWVEHSISLGYRCRLINRPDMTSDEIVERLTWELRRIVEEALPIETIKVDSEKANELPAEFSELISWSSGKRAIRGNRLCDSCAFAMGPSVPDTSWLTKWDLKPLERDFVLRFPGSASWPEIDAWVPRKKLNREFDLEEKHIARMGVENIDQLNRRIEEDGGRKLVIMSHFYQTYRMVQIVQHLKKDFPARRIITIAGPSSSGKTTFARLLETYLVAQGFGARLINVDNYFKNRNKTPLDSSGEPDFECLEAIHTEMFGEHLKILLEGNEVLMPQFDFHTGVRHDNHTPIRLGEREFLLVEGIHGLNDALTPGIPKDSKFRVYASALTQLNIDRITRMSTSDSRLIRRMVRDSTQRGYTAEETISVWPSVKRGERKNIFPFQEDADAMFNSSLPYELPVLKKYAEPLLMEVPYVSPVYHTATKLLDILDCVKPIDQELVPITSLLREFIGNSIFT
jgi:uridine kinase